MNLARQALATVIFNAFPMLDLVLRIAASTAALCFVLFVAAVALGLPVLAYQGADWFLKRLNNVLRIA
ncbi:hypothetical protein DBB29_08715 [Pandoraea cepalis]|uniref:Uncharacterized protein n=1 Tax=Pandoraea cepalis TaxID=2508294 RepID=A0AAW7MLK3_9BURK|nr:hypothetical protein [Pandoraea cepalis]MDN4573655.1 hypothetical protein [Pandoraea cepalis]MDN4578197.1 hypothetical protein [Pandoraea cepalis]